MTEKLKQISIIFISLSWFTTECKHEFQLFDQQYLKGVNKPYYTTTNSDVTIKECMELCCNQPTYVFFTFKL